MVIWVTVSGRLSLHSNISVSIKLGLLTALTWTLCVSAVNAQGDTARALSLGETPKAYVDHSPEANLSRVLASHHVFKGVPFSSSVKDRQAIVVVNGYQSANYRLDAVQAAKVITGYAPGQFLTVAVRYMDYSGSGAYREVIISSRDITSLNAGTVKFADLARDAMEVVIYPGDSALTHFEKYLAVAEKQIEKGNYWEAEQVVDSVGTAPGAANSDRYTRDMLNLSQGFDSYGDLYRAARILERVVEQRRAAGTLGGADADVTVERLVSLYIEDKRLKEADALLQNLVKETPEEKRHTDSYANNLERLAVIKLRLGQNEEAQSSLKEVLAIREAQSDASSSYARTLENMGDAYKAAGKRGDALAVYRKAKAIYDRAVVNPKRDQQIDYQVYAGKVKQLDEKLKQL